MVFFALQGALIVIGVAIACVLKMKGLLTRLQFDPDSMGKTGILTLPPLMLAVFFSSTWALTRYGFLREIFEKVMQTYFGRFIALGSAWTLGGISLLAGVGEELLFRGILQAKIGLPAASLIFGALHSLSWAFFAIATLMGAYLGQVYISTGHNLAAPIIIHALYDFTVLMLMRRLVNNKLIEPT